ncbi:hypothetical protein CBL_01547 [Carabus blaptoides fortunei]
MWKVVSVVFLVGLVSGEEPREKRGLDIGSHGGFGGGHIDGYTQFHSGALTISFHP